jgi:hypothetical protein
LHQQRPLSLARSRVLPTSTEHFHLYYPEQIPKTFAMSQLPSEILSWVSSVLQTAASPMIADRKAATKTRTEPGADGWDSAERQASLLTPSSLAYREPGTNYSVALSSHASAAVAGPPVASMMASVSDQWSQALCKKPQAMWLRRFGTICNRAPFTSRAQPSCIHSPRPCSRPLTMSTLPQKASEPSHPSFCEGCSA